MAHTHVDVNRAHGVYLVSLWDMRGVRNALCMIVLLQLGGEVRELIL